MTAGPYAEAELLQLAAQGNEPAFTALFRLYKYRLFGFLYKLTESAEMAEDLVQEIFLKLWQNRSDLAGIDNFSAYLFRMAQNQAINAFKRMAKETLILSRLEQETRPSLNAEDALAVRQLEETLKKLIDQLPPQQKLVYILSREHGLKHEEIAARLSIAPGTVKNHMIQALRTLRDQLARYPGTPLLVLHFMAITRLVENNC